VQSSRAKKPNRMERQKPYLAYNRV
jgi:hypothetical protein